MILFELYNYLVGHSCGGVDDVSDDGDEQNNRKRVLRSYFLYVEGGGEGELTWRLSASVLICEKETI